MVYIVYLLLCCLLFSCGMPSQCARRYLPLIIKDNFLEV